MHIKVYNIYFVKQKKQRRCSKQL